MSESLRTRLKRVELAIKEVLEAGQSMSHEDGISYTRASLPQLRAMEKDLRNALGRKNSTRPLFRNVAMRGGYGSEQ